MHTYVRSENNIYSHPQMEKLRQKTYWHKFSFRKSNIKHDDLRCWYKSMGIKCENIWHKNGTFCVYHENMWNMSVCADTWKKSVSTRCLTCTISVSWNENDAINLYRYIRHSLMIFQMWNGAWNKLQFKICQVAQASVVYLHKHSTWDPVMVSIVSSIPSGRLQFFAKIF